MDKTKKSLNVRAFVSLAAAFSGLGLPVTGYANHLYQFSPMTVGRHAWMAAHNILGALFVLFSVWHVVLNRRALLQHAKGMASRLPSIGREAELAGAIVAVFLFVFVGHAFALR